MMHKTILRLIAVIILPVLLAACSEHEAGNKVDKDLLASTLQKSLDMASALDNLNLKAFGMARLGSEMASTDPAGATAVLNEALAYGVEPHSSTYRAALAGLKDTTSSWPRAEYEQVAGALKRIEEATSRVWVVRAVAEGMAKVDRARALQVLKDCAAEAANIPDPRYRDLDLRAVSAQMATLDIESAMGVAAQVGDPRVKSWALVEIANVVAPSDQEGARRILFMAAEVAKGIPSAVQPSSELVGDETPAEARETVMGAEKARITASGARSMRMVASAMNKVNRADARTLFTAAAGMASGIDAAKHPYTKAYALSDVAIGLAELDPAAAEEMAASIPEGHEDARFAALLRAAQVRARTASGATMDAYVDRALTVAEAIEDEYDRAKALAALAKLMTPLSTDKAVEIASMIEEELGHGTYAYSRIKDDVLAGVAVELASRDAEAAKKVLEPTPEELAKGHGRYVAEPRFAKAAALYKKAEAFVGMADATLAKDPTGAAKLYAKAAGAAKDAKSARLQWAVAERLCKMDKAQFFEYAATIEPGDFAGQADAMSSVASDWASKGYAESGMVWDVAVKAANTLGDDMESADALLKVAARCAPHDRARASEIYQMAHKRLAKIGMEAEG